MFLSHDRQLRAAKGSLFFRKFYITLRDETEWIELVDNGVNLLTGADYNRILPAWEFSSGADLKERDLALYGNGTSAQTIVKELTQ